MILSPKTLLKSVHAALMNSLFSWNFPQKFCRFLLILSCTIVLTISPAWGAGSLLSPVKQSGTLEYAPVIINGQSTLTLADRLPSGEVSGKRPVEKRIRAIETELNRILEEGFDPATFQVSVATLNNQPVLMLSDQVDLLPRPVLTVTEYDGELANQPVQALAEQWKVEIKTVMLAAYAERQPEALQQRLRGTLLVICLTIIVSFFLHLIAQQFDHYLALHAPSTLLDESLENSNLTSSSTSISNSPVNPGYRDLPTHVEENIDTSFAVNEANKVSIDADFNIDQPTSITPQTNQPTNQQTKLELNFLSQLKQEKTRRKLLRLLRDVLSIGQGAVLLSGLIGICYLFPQTRLFALWLLGFPSQVAGIWIGVSLVSRTIDVFIDRSLRLWAERMAITSDTSHRFTQRVPTLMNALSGTSHLLISLLGLLIFIGLQPFSFGSILTGAGILGAAVTLVFQNLIKDFVNGILILWEDQFAVGDVIDIGVGKGLVEQVGLRVTKLRGEGGRLSVIPNSQILFVHNLTKEWSRVDFRIRVDLTVDLTIAMQTMREVGQQMQTDPEWRDRLLDALMLIGVDRLDDQGAEILQWMKTKPGEQWNVEREYRQRLKLAFAQAKITIASPKLELQVLPTDSNFTLKSQ